MDELKGPGIADELVVDRTPTLHHRGMNGRTKWGSFLAGLSLSAAYILGCATAQVVPTARAAPPEGVQQWSYECTDGYNPETIMTRANALGQEGWELVAGVGSPRALGLWCFKRPT